jgi:hypothetical protein
MHYVILSAAKDPGPGLLNRPGPGCFAALRMTTQPQRG